MRRAKGFTLIELLVVLSIIALLVSILSPALSSVKEQARGVVCMTREKDLLLAWATYAAANEGMLCGSYNYYGDGYSSEFADSSAWVWAAWSGRLNEAVIGNPYDLDTWPASGITKKQKEEGIKRGSIWPYSDDIDVYRCPSDKNINEHVRSYSITDNMNGKFPEVFPGAANWEIIRKLENITRPSSSYVFVEESSNEPYNMDSFVVIIGKNDWYDSLAVWHRGASSFAFADGHVEQRHWSKETEARFVYAEEANQKLEAWTPDTAGGIDDFNWMKAGWAPQ